MNPDFPVLGKEMGVSLSWEGKMGQGRGGGGGRVRGRRSIWREKGKKRTVSWKHKKKWEV